MSPSLSSSSIFLDIASLHLRRHSPDSVSSKLSAEYKLLSLKLASASDNTSMLDVLNTSSDLQLAAFKNHCETRAATGKPKYGHFYEMWLKARYEYSDLFFVYQPRIGR